MIVRGTTPYHSFILPMAVESISELYVTYLQNGEIVLDKSMGDGNLELKNVDLSTENANVENLTDEEIEIDPSCKLTIHLTQEDTLAFKFFPAAEKNIAVIQVRVLDNNGEAYASDPIRERIYGVLKDGVIGESSNEEIQG